jgi:L1 cell adhesion molecule like protein
MKSICSTNNDSILRDMHEGVKYFSWETVWLELLRELPTLMKLLITLLPRYGSKHIPLLCVIASMLLKRRLGKMAFVQRAISVLLYGNGCSKQVWLSTCFLHFMYCFQIFNCLQPLMVCLSHSGTLKMIDKLSEDHDVDVQFWSHELLNNLKVNFLVDFKHYFYITTEKNISQFTNWFFSPCF